MRCCYALPVAVLLAISSIDAEASFPIRYRQIGGTTYVYLYDVAKYYGLLTSVSGNEITLQAGQTDIRMTVGSRPITINNVVFHLCHAPTGNGNAVMISERDLSLCFEPILRPSSLADGNANIRRIVIDAGHGGRDSGAKGRRNTEKSINLKIAVELKRKLEAHGYDVFMVRETDVAVTLGERVRRCAAWHGDLFISIHCNSAVSRHANGIETFIVPPIGTPESDGQKPSAETPGNQYDKFNARLAYDVHRYLVAYSGSTDRGVKHKRFYVLKQAHCPTILLEAGFLSNTDEEAMLGNAKHRRNLAEAVATGIVMYHRAIAGM
jgi:N-acetylmuramoyl-L-alanine amidase